MNMTFTWQGLGVIFAFIVQMIFVVWHASKLASKVDTTNNTLIRIDRELEKRDQQLAAMWKKVDRMAERLIRVETKTGICHKEEER